MFDHGGNQLRSIAFDREVVELAGYEDLLAVVYHDGVPMWGCQSLRMQIYRINSNLGGESSLVCSTFVPLKLQSVLKSFGFSAEGLIYAQDSKGLIRVYNFEKVEWTLIYDPSLAEDDQDKRLWLIGITNY